MKNAIYPVQGFEHEKGYAGSVVGERRECRQHFFWVTEVSLHVHWHIDYSHDVDIVTVG